MPPNRIPAEGRSASTDLWRRTLSQIPSGFGRLVYLASLRDPNTGRYQHHGLAAMFGPDEAHRALRLSHNASCREWLRRSLEEQKTDLDCWLATQKAQPGEIVKNWLEIEYWRTLLPESIRGAERALFIADLDALLSLLPREDGGSPADSGASPRRLPGL